MLAIGFSYVDFIMLASFLIPNCWELYHELVLDIVKSYFLHLLRWSWALKKFFIVLIWHITIDFCMLKHLCISGINPTWLQYIILLMCYWIQLASILLKIFFFHVSSWGIWAGSFLFCGVISKRASPTQVRMAILKKNKQNKDSTCW